MCEESVTAIELLKKILGEDTFVEYHKPDCDKPPCWCLYFYRDQEFILTPLRGCDLDPDLTTREEVARYTLKYLYEYLEDRRWQALDEKEEAMRALEAAQIWVKRNEDEIEETRIGLEGIASFFQGK